MTFADTAQQALTHIDRLRRGLDERSLIEADVAMSLIAGACSSRCRVVSQDHIILRTYAAAQVWAGVRVHMRLCGRDCAAQQ